MFVVICALAILAGVAALLLSEFGLGPKDYLQRIRQQRFSEIPTWATTIAYLCLAGLLVALLLLIIMKLDGALAF